MKKLRNHLLGIDQGSVVMFSDFEDDGEMWAGQGPRLTRKKVKFSEAYREAPSVHVAMSMWDTDHGTNQRADISAEKITETGFDLVFRTWGDSRVARVRADWMAMGEVPDEEEWELY